MSTCTRSMPTRTQQQVQRHDKQPNSEMKQGESNVVVII